MQKTVILDTNFLLIPYQFNVDILAEIARICDFKPEIVILDRTLEELEKIKNEQKGKNKLAASFALTLLKKKDLKIICTHSKKHVDDLLVEQAEKGAIIATQDFALKKRIRAKKCRLIILRSKNFLKLE